MAAAEILLIDDAPDMEVVVTMLGRRAGWKVDCRPDAASGWDFLQSAVPDLVLLDVNLPGISGPQLCRRIRQTPQTVPLGVALFTHWGLPEDIAAGLEAGVDYFVCKDLVGQPQDFRRRLAEILPKEHGQERPRHLRWNPGLVTSLPDWMERLQMALRHPTLRGVRPEIMRFVVRRALLAAFGSGPPGSAVLPDGRTFDPKQLPEAPDPVELIELVTSLAEQMWCLLGTAGSAAFWEALAAVAPGSPELLMAG